MFFIPNFAQHMITTYTQRMLTEVMVGWKSSPGWWFGGSCTGSLPVPTRDLAISALVIVCISGWSLFYGIQVEQLPALCIKGSDSYLMGRSRTIGADNEMAGPPGGPANEMHVYIVRRGGQNQLVSIFKAPEGGPPGGPPAVTETLWGASWGVVECACCTGRLP